MLYNITIFFSLSIFFIPAGVLIARYKELPKNKSKLIGIFLGTYFLYGLYMLICYSASIDDPLYDYISDHLFFYENPLMLSNYSPSEIIRESFSDFTYSDTPMAICLSALYIRFLRFFYSFKDFGIALMVPIIFFAALIPVFMGKTLANLNLFNRQTRNAILVFAFCSPLFYYSAYLYRDVYVYFLYTLILYFLLVKNIPLRYLYIFLLILVTYYFRKESGLYCLAFIGSYLCGFWIEKYSKYKYFFFMIGGVLGLVILSLVFNILMTTLISYNTRSLLEANNISLGTKVAANIPFPFNYILLSCFSQILPFPFYHRITLCDTSWMIFPDWRLHLFSCIIPFYWSYIICVIIMTWRSRVIKTEIRFLFYSALLFIFLTSIAEFNLRRQMVIGPLFFYTYIILSHNLPLAKKTEFFIFSTLGLLLLHVFYYSLLLIYR